MPVALVTQARTLARSEFFDLYAVDFEVASLVTNFWPQEGEEKWR